MASRREPSRFDAYTYRERVTRLPKEMANAGKHSEKRAKACKSVQKRAKACKSVQDAAAKEVSCRGRDDLSGSLAGLVSREESSR
jgi:hypothetical protein